MLCAELGRYFIFYFESMHTVFFTRSSFPLVIYIYIYFLSVFPKCFKAYTTTKPLIPSVLRRLWAQWCFQHPNETRSILLWLVILDSSLAGLLTPLLDFEDLRSSVQPFAAGSALPLWPARQKLTERARQSCVSAPCWAFFFFFPVPRSCLCCLSCRPFGKTPNCKVATSLSLTSFGYWTHSAEFSNLYSLATRLKRVWMLWRIPVK